MGREERTEERGREERAVSNDIHNPCHFHAFNYRRPPANAKLLLDAITSRFCSLSRSARMTNVAITPLITPPARRTLAGY